ncbi:hypothetical protein Anas_01311 [Armadillidium nasatum]|uniref:Uncharacterized protein n=1 Tax=Armadillidium nasatum TaxID=96803 RepID=A0A5N5THE3_9CRUS|nr:hypothetical protein Anas_01311 [Armadillidium nasatum]
MTSLVLKQALKSRQRDQKDQKEQKDQKDQRDLRDQSPARNTLDSRVPSPGDSGFAFSSASGSDHEGDSRGTLSLPPMSSPPTGSHSHSFKNSLSLFQKAANIVANNTRNFANGGHRQKDQDKPTKRSSEKAWRENIPKSGVLKDPGGSATGQSTPAGESKRESEGDDNETYEQVLYINGRPQFQGEAKRVKSNQTEIKNNSPLDQSDNEQSSSHPVDSGPSQRLDAFGNPLYSKSLGDITSCVTLPRRKPVLNFGSVSDELSKERGLILSSGDSAVNGSDYYEKNFTSDTLNNNSKHSTITRAHSFKEGLDSTYDTPKPVPLSRAQSLYDGLDTDQENSVNKSKINDAPSVDEILESVKSLRAQKNTMVKSSPDLLLQTSQEKSFNSNNSRHKSGKSSGKSSKKSSSNSSGSSGSNSITSGSRKSSSSHDSKYEKSKGRNGSKSRHCELVDSYYENIQHSESEYENIPAAHVDVIYDKPKSTKVVVVDKCVGGITDKRKDRHKQIDYYENVNFDPVYENLDDDLEPTYMNVDDDISQSDYYNGRNNIYANIEEENRNKKSSRKHNKAGLIPLNYDDEFTYDVPKSAAPIYDTPPKQTRKVLSKRIEIENEYDTPHNNQSVILPHSSKMVIKSKTDQMKRIEDIFADCDKDSLDGDLAEVGHLGKTQRPHSGE